MCYYSIIVCREPSWCHSSAAAAAASARVYTDTFNEKKRLTPYVFAYIYKLSYTYVYPYNHTNMFLGCAGRGPGPWEPLVGPRGLRNWENWKCPRTGTWLSTFNRSYSYKTIPGLKYGLKHARDNYTVIDLPQLDNALHRECAQTPRYQLLPNGSERRLHGSVQRDHHQL